MSDTCPEGMDENAVEGASNKLVFLDTTLREGARVQFAGKNFIVGRSLGWGAYAQVWSAYSAEGQEIVIKAFLNPIHAKQLASIKVLRDALGDIPSRDMTRVLSDMVESSCVVLSHGGYEDVSKASSESGALERAHLARQLAICVSSTLVRLHAHGFTHTDIKPANLGNYGAGQICILDVDTLGEAGVRNWRRSLPVTPKFVSPLVLSSWIRGVPTFQGEDDLYSLGVTLFNTAFSGRVFSCIFPGIDRVTFDEQGMDAQKSLQALHCLHASGNFLDRDFLQSITQGRSGSILLIPGSPSASDELSVVSRRVAQFAARLIGGGEEAVAAASEAGAFFDFSRGVGWEPSPAVLSDGGTAFMAQAK